MAPVACKLTDILPAVCRSFWQHYASAQTRTEVFDSAGVEPTKMHCRMKVQSGDASVAASNLQKKVSSLQTLKLILPNLEELRLAVKEHTLLNGFFPAGIYSASEHAFSMQEAILKSNTAL